MKIIKHYPNTIENKITSTLKNLPPQTKFIAAVSGGADSMALLSVLETCVEKDRIFCLHVEHGIRSAEESRGDAQFVREYCKKNEINCRIVSVKSGKVESFSRKHGTGIEAAARHFRRRIFLRYAAALGENVRILTAHTKDDTLELALMRVLRGAGPAGLSLMPESKGIFLRPMLSITKREIIEYLKEKQITWREDSTNAGDDYLRNRVRHRLIPVLNEFFPAWQKGILNMAQLQTLTAGFLTQEAKQRIIWSFENNFLFTDKTCFFNQPQIIREEAVFQGINLLGSSLKKSFPNNIKRSVVRKFCSGKTVSADLGILRLRQEKEKVSISLVSDKISERGFSLLIKKTGSYTLKKKKVDIEEWKGEDINSGFICTLPLVFRYSYKDDFLFCKGRKIKKRDLKGNGFISAVDSLGTLNEPKEQSFQSTGSCAVSIAAFLDSNGLLFTRDLPEIKNQLLYKVIVH